MRWQFTWPPDWDEVRKKAEAGDAVAQYVFAWKFEEEKAVDKARDWLEKAAAQGQGMAHYRRAHLGPDAADRLAWLIRGAEMGDAHSQCDLGIGYWNGWDCPKDEERGTAWLLRAAQQSYCLAEYHLYSAYSEGRGVACDAAEAARFVRLSSEHGYGWAMLVWSGVLALGKGVPEDRIEAYKWLLLSMPDRGDRDYPAFKQDLDALGKRMKKVEIEEAKRRRRKWRPTPPTIDVWTRKYYEGL